MSRVIGKRVTARVNGDFVVFLIGMRINKVWKLHKWLPVFLAMPNLVTTAKQIELPFWIDELAFETADAVGALRDEDDVTWAFHPTTRNLPNLLLAGPQRKRPRDLGDGTRRPQDHRRSFQRKGGTQRRERNGELVGAIQKLPIECCE